MDINNVSGYTLKSLSKINVLLGKNGSGKSTLFRLVEQNLISGNEDYGKTRYVTPERGGALIYEAGIEQSIGADINWLSNQNRKNQNNQFRQQSVAQFRRLKELVLEEIEQDEDKRSDLTYKFDLYIEKINSLLENIEIKRHNSTFKIYKRDTTEEINANNISSGESELISLGIECLIFNKEAIPEKENLLFLDEPDVHLHPDLQSKLISFLKKIVDEERIAILIATHSTAVLGELSNYTKASIAFIKLGNKEINFKPINEIYKKVLPIFGAHPLSNLFNEAPVLLVEGEDDERIWQQAVRTSNGNLKVYPCACEGVQELSEFEVETNNIISAVYDNPKAYSLRDRDDNPEEIDDLPPIIRFRLSCRSAENLLLTNEVLDFLSTNWNEIKANIERWLTNNSEHVKFSQLKEFKDGGYDRKSSDLKQVRMLLMGAIIGSNKPWEVAVGQVIGNLKQDDATEYNSEGSIFNFLGGKLVKEIIPSHT